MLEGQSKLQSTGLLDIPGHERESHRNCSPNPGAQRWWGVTHCSGTWFLHRIQDTPRRSAHSPLQEERHEVLSQTAFTGLQNGAAGDALGH